MLFRFTKFEDQMTRLSPALLLIATATVALAQTTPLERNGQTITIEAYAPNIVRVTLSNIAKEAEAGPGYGFVAKPDETGWKHAVLNNGADTYASDRMTVTVAPAYKRDPNQKLPDTAKFFSGSTAGAHVSVTLPDGSLLVEMDGWQMAELNRSEERRV